MCYCTVFALFYFEYEGNFRVQDPGAFIWKGLFNGGFFFVTSLGGLYLEGLIHGWAHFRTFTVLAFITVTIKELLETD